MEKKNTNAKTIDIDRNIDIVNLGKSSMKRVRVP